MIPCLSCGRGSNDEQIWSSAEEEREFATEWVYPQWEGKQTCMCNLCYERKRFRSLTRSQVSDLHYMFSEPFSESTRNLDLRIKRLRASISIEESGEVLAALGHALWKDGRDKEARRVLRTAVAGWMNFFGASKAWAILRRIDLRYKEFYDARISAGVTIKRVSEEFPGSPLRKRHSKSPNNAVQRKGVGVRR